MKLIPIRIASGSFMESDDGWASTDIATVNRNVVRCRTMERIVAPWHVHADSDELFYILSGQLHLDTDEGTATVGGRPYRRWPQPLRQVGCLLDAAALQPSRTGRNHLLWLAHSQGLSSRRVDEVIVQAGFDKAARRKAGGYSLGMRQRLGIAAAMLGDPPVLMLDEPFNGLDPEGIVWVRGFLRSLAAEGRAVLVSSHLMSELEGAATHLVVIGRGRLVADTSVAELISQASAGLVTLRTTARAEATTVLASAGALVATIDTDTLTNAGKIVTQSDDPTWQEYFEGELTDQSSASLDVNSGKFTMPSPNGGGLAPSYPYSVTNDGSVAVAPNAAMVLAGGLGDTGEPDL